MNIFVLSITHKWDPNYQQINMGFSFENIFFR